MFRFRTGGYAKPRENGIEDPHTESVAGFGYRCPSSVSVRKYATGMGGGLEGRGGVFGFT